MHAKRWEMKSCMLPAMLLAALVTASLLSTGCTLHIGNDRLGGSGMNRFAPGTPYPCRVVHVTDGDTLRVAFPGGNEETVRIVGIDTPEVTPEGNEPSSFAGISDPWFLSAWGKEASSILRREVEGGVVTITTDRAAGERDRYGRLLAYVHTANRTDVGELLLSQGLARVYTKESFGRRAHYLDIQDRAMSNRIGVWSGMVPSPLQQSGIFIAAVHYDAAGDDRFNLNDEYITLGNEAGYPITLTGWQVRDSDGFCYILPETALLPGGRLVLHTGPGTDSGTEIFMGSPTPVLNNDGDTVTVHDAAGTEISRFAW
ncbi:MAG TPA: thermonuclease family protein [Methanoregulaceae archaeon]|nr:MAG: thermonuclease family protein [Methanolinea sp.]HON81240.1 thermonuclease family protein [Methanoregulaceae archaeon]HRT15160.1 thermonuclease family protein [Methanoregulaceae archaeon]HRU30723.1 thermonuclease family protein [Methanoregulaceae archaeon]